MYKKTSSGPVWLIVRHKTAGHWGFPKGHIGDNVVDEKMEDAALREVAEEGGVTAHIADVAPVLTTYFFRRGMVLHKKTVHYFLMKYVSGDTANHDDEVSDAKFVDEVELLKTLTYDTDTEAFRKLRGRMPV